MEKIIKITPSQIAKMINDLLDENENLKEANKELIQSNDEWYELSVRQSEREYHSKFLKDFQEEHGKNCFPDHDEIYKRYDNQKKEIARLNHFLDFYADLTEKQQIVIKKKNKQINDMEKYYKDKIKELKKHDKN